MPRGQWQRSGVRRTAESAFALDIRPLARGWLPDEGPRHRSVPWSRGSASATDAELFRDALLAQARPAVEREPSEASVSVTLTSDVDALILYCVDGREVSERVALDSTPCSYGGRRWWWLCPGCGGRCAILYLRERFECRTCSGLTYVTSQASEWVRRARKAKRLRRRLESPLGVIGKPAGMHARTFERLLSEAVAAEEAAAQSFAPVLERLRAQRPPLDGRRSDS